MKSGWFNILMDKNVIALSSSSSVLLYSRNRIMTNCEFIYQEAKKVFGEIVPFFAMKVAPVLGVAEVIRECPHWGGEVYNDSDLDMAKTVGFEKVIADGYYKPDRFLERCVDCDVLSVNIDSIGEAKLLNEICLSRKKHMRVGIRCKISASSKMGMSYDEVLCAMPMFKQLANIEVCGVHIHPCSNAQGMPLAYDAYRNEARVAWILKQNGFRLRYVDIGGGIKEILAHGTNLQDHFRRIKEIFNGLNPDEYYIEPGRGVVGDAGALVCHVASVDHSDKLINVDIAVYPYLSTTGATFDCLFPDNLSDRLGFLDFGIGGIWPTSIDVIPAEKVRGLIPRDVTRGNRFVLLNAGAYVADRLSDYAFSEIPIKIVQ